MYEGVNNEKSPSALPPATKVTTSFLCGFPEIVYAHTANVYKSMVLSLSFTNVSFTVSCTQLGIYLVILLWAAGAFALLLFFYSCTVFHCVCTGAYLPRCPLFHLNVEGASRSVLYFSTVHLNLHLSLPHRCRPGEA